MGGLVLVRGRQVRRKRTGYWPRPCRRANRPREGLQLRLQVALQNRTKTGAFSETAAQTGGSLEQELQPAAARFLNSDSLQNIDSLNFSVRVFDCLVISCFD